MIKNFIRNNAFIEYNISQFLFIINNCLAYIITFCIDFMRFKYSIIKKVIDNLNIKFDIIEV